MERERKTRKLMPLISSRIDSAWRRYKAEVDVIVSMVFVRAIKPYCQDNKLSFKVKDGVWWISTDGIFDKRLRGSIDRDIINLLQEEIPGMPGVDLGSLMPDYEYKSEQ